MAKVRLNKWIADCTGVSRRKADTLIEEDHVRVNRKPPVLGQMIDPEKDKVTVEGKPLLPQKKYYIAFYKPPGYITTRSDPEGRKTIYDLLPLKYQDLDPAGRLDRSSSGLLLLSNDGEFIQKLSHPRYAHKKIYRVKVNTPLTPEVLQKLEAGILLQPENKLAQCQVQEIIEMKTVVLALTTGMNRQIRRCFEALGYEVESLKRIAFAGITLHQLRPGQTRQLKPSELKSLQLPPKTNSGKRHPSQKRSKRQKPQ